jgi:hypothetical protein
LPEAPKTKNLQKFNFAIKKLLQSPKSLFKFSIEMIQAARSRTAQSNFPEQKNVEESLKPQA